MESEEGTAFESLPRRKLCRNKVDQPFLFLNPQFTARRSLRCQLPLFETRLNTLPSATRESRSQTSIRPLHQRGTGTVRSRPPFPTISTMTPMTFSQ
jgi:hypothetical protein